MTVYYYDLFTGTAGTLLTSHTADSGATWPNDADHYYGTGIVTLDGLGGVYQSNTGSSINLSSAAMPSTGPFFPQKLPQTTRTCVPSSSVISGISPVFTS